MCQGETTHVVDGHEIRLREGEQLFLNQHAVQAIRPAEREDIAVNFIILPEFFDTAFRMMGEEENLLRDFIVGCLCDDTRYGRYLHFQIADVLPVQNLVENMVRTLLNQREEIQSIMKQYYLAVDIGASSGRHILGWVEDRIMRIREIYRFSNGMEPVDGTLCWDLEELFEEILAGMRACAALGINPVTMGIDTWAVDFVLLDKSGQVLGKTAGYRDSRTQGMDQRVYERVTPEELYERTGIQNQIFNTVYQLMAVKESQPELLSQARSFLMIPDYLGYLLTGVMKQEYTNATTTQLVSPATRTWDRELIERLGYPQKLFGELSMPGAKVGRLREEVCASTGLDCQVTLPATHDMGSAVAAVPSNQENVLYISSGTWSLMGTELR